MRGRAVYLTERERRTVAALLDGKLVGRGRPEVAATLRRVSVKLCCGDDWRHAPPRGRR